MLPKFEPDGDPLGHTCPTGVYFEWIVWYTYVKALNRHCWRLEEESAI